MSMQSRLVNDYYSAGPGHGLARPGGRRDTIAAINRQDYSRTGTVLALIYPGTGTVQSTPAETRTCTVV